MPKSLAQYNDQDRKELLDKLKAVYEKHGNPAWLQPPKIYLECVNILSAGQQQIQEVLQIDGKAPMDAKQLMTQVKEDIEKAANDVLEKEIEIRCCHYLDTQMLKIENAEKIYIKEQPESGKANIEHENDKVYLLDFWASWCPPCQKPMADNQKMLEDNVDWGDKVRIIGLSIDTDEKKLKEWIKEKKYTKVEHYWVRNGQCTADVDFGGVAVPHVLLVDKSGKIVFMGHPALRNLEQDIKDLLEGKPIKGDGTITPNAEANEVCKEADIVKFKEDTLKFTNSIKDEALGMQRAFLVLTCDRTMDFQNNKYKYNSTTHTVLVGPKDKVEKLHTECKKYGESSAWVNRDQIQSV